MNQAQFVVFKASEGHWRWLLHHGASSIAGASQSYPTKDACLQAIADVKETVVDAEVEEVA